MMWDNFYDRTLGEEKAAKLYVTHDFGDTKEHVITY